PLITATRKPGAEIKVGSVEPSANKAVVIFSALNAEHIPDRSVVAFFFQAQPNCNLRNGHDFNRATGSARPDRRRKSVNKKVDRLQCPNSFGCDTFKYQGRLPTRLRRKT